MNESVRRVASIFRKILYKPNYALSINFSSARRKKYTLRMSKLAIVLLCATIFFASSLAEGGETLAGWQLRERVQTARISIEKSLKDVHDKVYTLGAQPSHINFEIIREMEENVTKKMDEVRRLAGISMKMSSVKNIKSECSRLYRNYEALATSVIKSLNSCVSDVAFSVLEFLGEKITAATETIRNMDKIAKWAPLCEGVWCAYANNGVASSRKNTLTSLKEALEDYEMLANGSSVREAARMETDYNHFIESEDAFWNKFLNCVTTPSDPTTPKA